MKVISIVGARPQFVKAAMVSRALRKANAREVLVHTGQHYDRAMSKVFFDEMGIPKPAVNLGVGSGTHGYQTGETMKGLEGVCAKHKPDAMIVFGDTNATLAGALVGAKLRIPVAHVEAGLRSFDRSMPEEVNRIVADHVSTWLFCPTKTAARNLANEGITRDVFNVGDVMYDASLHFGELACRKSRILEELGLEDKGFVLATIHRDFNTDNRGRLAGIVAGMIASGETVIFPAHPRVRKQMKTFRLESRINESPSCRIIDPLGFLDMVRLEKSAKAILTDSGGVQKEAFFYRVPCITVRPSTEWVETVEAGWNTLVEAGTHAICRALRRAKTPPGRRPAPYGRGDAAGRIVEKLRNAG